MRKVKTLKIYKKYENINLPGKEVLSNDEILFKKIYQIVKFLKVQKYVVLKGYRETIINSWWDSKNCFSGVFENSYN